MKRTWGIVISVVLFTLVVIKALRPGTAHFGGKPDPNAMGIGNNYENQWQNADRAWKA